MIPILITIENNLTKSAVCARSGVHLEELFKRKCADYGVEACDKNFEDGYMELENGISICMTWAEPIPYRDAK